MSDEELTLFLVFISGANSGFSLQVLTKKARFHMYYKELLLVAFIIHETYPFFVARFSLQSRLGISSGLRNKKPARENKSGF
jgi:hypothetical protein